MLTKLDRLLKLVRRIIEKTNTTASYAKVREEKMAPKIKEFTDYCFIKLSLKEIKPINAKNLSGGLKYFKYQLKTLKGSRKNLEEG